MDTAYKQWTFIFISYYLLVLRYSTGPSDKRVIEKWSKDIPWEAIQNQNCSNLTTTCQFVRLCHHTHGSVPCSKPWLLWYLMIHGHCNIKFWVPTKESKMNQSITKCKWKIPKFSYSANGLFLRKAKSSSLWHVVMSLFKS